MSVFGKFPRTFWVANVIELFERWAWYGFFMLFANYLTGSSDAGGLEFTQEQKGWLMGVGTGILYFLPVLTGAIADRYGYRKVLFLAFLIYVSAFLLLPQFSTFTGVFLMYLYLAVGAALFKPVISATIAKTTTDATASIGFGIFYMMVNIGAFSGKVLVTPLRDAMGHEGMIVLNYFSAGMTFLALIAIYLFYKSDKHAGEGKTFGQIWTALVKVCTNGRLIVLILIITGFWMVQHQLYATMPKYVTRLAGEASAIGWYANVNPLVVVLTVNLVTSLMRKKSALFSMTCGMFIMPISALCMASGNMLGGGEILGLHPVAFMMIVGIVFQGLAEVFISPRFLEYFSLQAPKGEEGMYLGFSHLHSFLSSIFGFGLSGFLLSKYCPARELFSSEADWMAASANAHYIWYYFAAIALVSAVALIIYGKVVRRLDTKKAAATR